MSTFAIRDLNRRDFLRFGRDATAAVALGSLPAFGGERSAAFSARARSDPAWPPAIRCPTASCCGRASTREVLDRSGALGLPVPVHWEIAEDDSFRHIVRKGSHLAVGELGHSVHAEVDGLRPGRHYWYRFMAGGEVSADGPNANGAGRQTRRSIGSGSPSSPARTTRPDTSRPTAGSRRRISTSSFILATTSTKRAPWARRGPCGCRRSAASSSRSISTERGMRATRRIRTCRPRTRCFRLS